MAYATQNKLNYTQLVNQAGHAVKPSIESFKAAAANAKWDPVKGFDLILTDQRGKGSWPITASTFIIMPKNPNTKEKVQMTDLALAAFNFCLTQGQTVAEKLHYVPLPDNVVTLIEQYWKENIKAPDGKAIWK